MEKSRSDKQISVFNTINNPDLAENPSDLIFYTDGANYTFARMEDDDIVVQPCFPTGEPDPALPRIKVQKNILKAEGFRIRPKTPIVDK